MRDVKGRHDLITREWTKLGAHTRSNTSVFKTPRVFFSGKYDFNVLPLSLQSYSCPSRTSQFLEAVATTRTTMTLAYKTTTQEISCHSARQVLYLMLFEYTTPVYLAIYGYCSQRFLCHCSYTCSLLTSIMSSNYVGGIPCMPMCN